MQNSLRILIAIASLSSSLYASAEVLKLDTGSVLVRQEADMPKRGMSKQTIETRYGAPLRKHPAVGKPAISSWEYASFTTYFEGNLALHSVLHAAPKR